MTTTTALEKAPQLKIASVEEAKAWGQMAKEAQVIPATMSPIQAAAIVQTGRELGLHPFQSLRSISFIKGKLCMSVQLQLAMARAKGVQTQKGWLKEESGQCTVTLTRGVEEVTCTYTLEDAKKAKLVIPDGNWDKYARQMLRWRAIGDALRLIAPDAVMGLLSPEEAESITEDGRVEYAREITPIGRGDEPSAGGNKPEPEAVHGSVPETHGGKFSGVPDKLPERVPEKPVEKAPEVGVEEEVSTKTQKFISQKKGKFGFLDQMGLMKKALGEKTYYAILGDFKFAHANEVEDRDTMKLIYWKMKRVADEMNPFAEDESHE